MLPTWARTGFSDPRPRLPHVLGRSGEIAALVFGYPLRSPPAKDRGNKILWVSRRAVKPLSDLRIRAQRMEGAVASAGRSRASWWAVRARRGSTCPAPGCWRLTLRWSGRTDELDLRYVRPLAAAARAISSSSCLQSSVARPAVSASWSVTV